MCGITAWVGKDPKEFNKQKFDIITILNEVRGTDSCGIAVDGSLWKGHEGNNLKVYRNFLTKTKYDLPKESAVVIGHTRAATGGSKHLEKFAHPFKFEIDEGKNWVVGAHNGVLKNHEELAEKYNIKLEDKIDSQVLLEILANYRSEEEYPDNHNNNDDVLIDYIGAAAIVITNSKIPNELWCFRGESKVSDYKNAATEEERPLAFYQESPTSMYICSLSHSLKAICDEKSNDSIKEFRTNVLYCIRDGQIVHRFEVNRNIASLRNLPTRTYRSNTNTNTSCSTGSSSSRTRQLEIEANEDLVNAYQSKTIDIGRSDDFKKNNIFYENVIFNNLKTEYYIENFMLKRNGHLATNGFYIFIEEEGFKFLTNDFNNIDKELKDFSYYWEQADEKVEFGDIRGKCRIYSCYNGVILENTKDYLNIIDKVKDGKKDIITTSFLSEHSIFPIIDLSKYNKAHLKGNRAIKVYSDSQTILKNGAIYSGVFSPIGSYKDYHIEYGNLTKTTTNENLNKPRKIEMISINNDGHFNDDTQEDNTFENEIVETMLNNKKEDLITLLELKTEYDNIFEHTEQQLHDLRDTQLVKNFKEFNNDNKSKFKTISSTLVELEKNSKETIDR